MAILIRRAGREDLGPLVPLVAACFESPWSESALKGALGGPASRSWLALAEPGAGVPALGFVLARRITDVLEIDLVGVAPGARRAGVAGRMLARLLETEAAAGAVEARLELSATNEAAARLYAALGFVVVGRRPRYYPDGSEALLLSRPLD